MYTYIKKDIEDIYLELSTKLDADSFSNLGTTWDDYLNNDFVLLSEQQVQFHKDHLNASVKEVFDLMLTPIPVTTLEDEKKHKIYEIDRFDYSPSVNNFMINGGDAWLDKATRVGLMNAIQIEKKAAKLTTTLWLNDVCFVIPCDMAIDMLSQLEMYALACFNKTAEHKNNVKNLTDIESVKSYDYTVGYPQQLNFIVKEKGASDEKKIVK